MRVLPCESSHELTVVAEQGCGCDVNVSFCIRQQAGILDLLCRDNHMIHLFCVLTYVQQQTFSYR